jgi:hypothetical protein
MSGLLSLLCCAAGPCPGRECAVAVLAVALPPLVELLLLPDETAECEAHV